MDKEYIEKEKVLKLIESGMAWNWGYNTLYDEVENLPAADVAPVVRCKDCIYAKERFGHLECDLGITIRKIWNSPDTFFGKGNNPNMFCSYGERREECETD
ncbi:hypothetical protein [Ligaoa zhengdingensis]|uniref:hypothetical protein n=1 Tax=Ligaoa zhengdingensis TaxID=2763658 RepID=UPI0031BB66A2